MRRKTRSVKMPKPIKSDEVSKVNLNNLRLERRFQTSKVKIECYNFTGRTIRTYDQSGLCLVHPTLTTTSGYKELNGQFVMCRQVSIHDETQAYQVENHAADSVFHDGENCNDDEFVGNLNRFKTLSRRNSSLYYAVSFKDIEEAGGGLYIGQVDMVVCDAAVRERFIHPSSSEYFDRKIEQLYDGSHTYSVEINDAKGESGPYFVNLNGQVFEIAATKDQALGDYARIIFKPPKQPAVTIAQSSLDEKELSTIGVFKKYSDADQYAEKHQIRIAELEREIQLSKATHDNHVLKSKTIVDERSSEHKLRELDLKLSSLEKQTTAEAAKAQFEMEKNLREKEKLELDIAREREKHNRDIEEMRMKYHYEAQSYQRKDSSEIVKFIPAIFGAGLAVFALLK